jgi:hypothetical protein
MQIWDWLYPLALLGVVLVLSFVVATHWPDWPLWRMSLFSAAMLPLPVLALCVWVFVDAMLTPAALCGVDACGMAMVAGMFLGAGAIGLFLVSWAAVFALHALLRRG